MIDFTSIEFNNQDYGTISLVLQKEDVELLKVLCNYFNAKRDMKLAHDKLMKLLELKE